MTGTVDARRAAIAELVRRVPHLRTLLSENVVENFGELVPTLFFADLLPWLVENQQDDEQSVKAVLAWMEEQLTSDSAEVRGMIVTSGIDDLTAAGHAGESLRRLLGPKTALINPWF